MEKNANISECGQYRYWLERIWNPTQQTIVFVMLNPSTADANEDDPTIRRCINFAKAWGYGSINVFNLYDFRSTDPDGLLKTERPFSDQNSHQIRVHCEAFPGIICAWGNPGMIKKLKKKFPNYNPLEGFEDKLYCLGFCKDGVTPRHPLFLKGDLKPIKL